MRTAVINGLHTAADRLSAKSYSLNQDGFNVLSIVIGKLSLWLGNTGDRLWVQQRSSTNDRLYAEAKVINSTSNLVTQMKIVSIFIVALVLTQRLPASLHAAPANLIGHCKGEIYAGLEEDQFPEGCDWIEPIKYQP